MGRTRRGRGDADDEADSHRGHAPGHGHGHSHAHAHGPASPVSTRLRRMVAAVLIPFAAAVVVGLVLLWPSGTPAHQRTGVGFDLETRDGRVTRIEELSCAQADAEAFGGEASGTGGTGGANDSPGTGAGGEAVSPAADGGAGTPGDLPWPPPPSAPRRRPARPLRAARPPSR